MKLFSLYFLLVALPVGAQQLGVKQMTPESDIGIHPESVYLKAPQGAVVKLSDEEYANLQKLRQAVVDEEKRLAVKYGWQGDRAIGDAVKPSVEHFIPADHYEFHQQFLLIDKGYAPRISDTPAEILKYLPDGTNKPIILNRFPDGSVLKGSAK